ncbi:GNAT family N-acetyltransferase [Entomospira culicis]|uniref:GNAT family N-acetyltransferase n=1 Tax=Entomospira culicis TaxID=2719989 RepID=A0A968KVG1_9SPIO|nr:GNAT family N-acetyltransferase [Entomospira culicis]NIZ19928.1 GNAT family N-acetyltransferase [Entomospira culicis]NIZ70115.1 GNAT family N-acetyltransferase [Entomospira culicis]WDI38042.1 GNAT family N-acetyltransferase [Entomospira culicis]WDI39665.1 GNAT family N-acetyltransferase [Entomospira culicis]
MRLAEVSSEYTVLLKAYQQAFILAKEICHGAPELTDGMRVEAWLVWVEDHKYVGTLPAGRVLSHSYILLNDKEDKVLGIINLRHYLNDYLRNFGGHVGYSVAPDARGRGYAKLMVAQLRPLAVEFGLDRLLLTCEESNVASLAVIRSTGACYEDRRLDGNRRWILRYWLTISEQ